MLSQTFVTLFNRHSGQAGVIPAFAGRRDPESRPGKVTGNFFEDEKVGKHLPVNVTGAIAAISMDMGFHWQMSKSFAILGRALGGLAHVGEKKKKHTTHPPPNKTTHKPKSKQ